MRHLRTLKAFAPSNSPDSGIEISPAEPQTEPDTEETKIMREKARQYEKAHPGSHCVVGQTKTGKPVGFCIRPPGTDI